MKLRLSSLAAEPYKLFGARLLHLCQTYFKQEISINLASAFAEHDRSMGNTLLWLTKHFASFPVDVGLRNGDVNSYELTRIIQQPGITVLIQGLPLQNTVSGIKGCPYDISDLSSERNIHTHLSIPDEIKDSIARASIKRFFQQISTCSQILKDEYARNNKPFVYVAGFNIIEADSLSANLPQGDFLPWYLLLGSEQGTLSNYKQPELSNFLLGFSTENSHVVNLETLVNNM